MYKNFYVNASQKVSIISNLAPDYFATICKSAIRCGNNFDAMFTYYIMYPIHLIVSRFSR